MKSKIRLGMNLIGVKDLYKAKEFYTKVFGMKVVEFNPPAFMEAKLGKNIFNIETNTPERDKNFSKNNIGGQKSCVFEVENIKKFLAHAQKHGAKIIKKPLLEPWNYWTAMISDNDGNKFIIEQENK